MYARRVLVTGVGGPSGRAAVTALRARGFTLIATDMRPVEHEGHSFFQVPPASDAGFAAALTELIARERVSWLFPTVSEELVTVAELAPALRAQGTAVFIPSPEATRLCHDKWDTAHALAVRGLAVPKSALGRAEDSAVLALGLPLVSRPRVGRGGRGVVVHDAPGTAPAVPDPLWQEFLPGSEYDVLLVRDPRAPHRLLMQQVFEKTALKDGRVGNAVDVRPVEAEDVARLAAAVAAALDLRGPADMDIRRGSDGVARLLEINARIGAHALRAPQLFDALVALFESGCRG
ncbi:MAG TPA: ATP-grasp domain-containing protein [Acidiferrobacterales bacterium]|nr:ATP-grasp domain-containing protein [Acidiferrobacterales bacterium]